MLFRLFSIALLAVGIYCLNFPLSEILFSTLLTVASIFFSIALTLITTFNFDKLKNLAVYESVKSNLYKVRNSCLKRFIFVIFAYLIGLYFKNPEICSDLVSFNSFLKDYSLLASKVITSLALSVMLISTCYFIVNLLEIQKLKDDINEQARKKN